MNLGRRTAEAAVPTGAVVAAANNRFLTGLSARFGMTKL